MDAIDKIWDIYIHSFPADERRDLESQKQILQNPHYRLQPVRHHGFIVGFAALWDLDQFVFLEHLAIEEGMRGHGLGTNTVKRLTSTYPRIVLEVEEPHTRIARSRVGFYRKLGFHLNPYDYLQPPYSPDKHSVPLLLMTFPDPIDDVQFDEIQDALQSIVYRSCGAPSDGKTL